LEAIREEVFRLYAPDLTEVGLKAALELACGVSASGPEFGVTGIMNRWT
jgi:hypothetical protein